MKEISKDKLVIIVSHDRESAKQYGDRIIEIKDGKIVSDSKHDTISISGTMDNYKNTKTKLPIKDSLKMALGNIFHKKIKLLFTSVITALTFLFLGLSFLLSVYDIRTSHAKVLTDDNSNFIQIENRGYTKEYLTGTLNPLKKEDINSIIEQSKREGVPIYQFQNSTSNIINDLKINLSNDFDDVHDFYTNIFPYMTTEIVELERADQILKESIVGRFPEKENEIVISNYIATLILENGITIYDSNQNDYKIPGIFKPKNFEELLSSDKTFYFGTLEGVKIVGVIDYDMNQFNQLKGIYREAVTSKEMDLNHELNMKSQYIYNKVYVKEGFINFYNKSSDKNLSENYKYELESNNINFYDYKSYYTSYQFLDEDVDYYDGEQWTTIDHLEKDQILLNIHQLSSFNLSTYEELLSKYLSNYENGNKVELEKNFLIQFLPDDLIGKKVNLNIYNQNSSLDQTYKDIEIIGIVGLTEQNQNSSFVSNNLDNNYKSSKFNTTGVMLSVHTEAEIKSLLKLFPYYSTYTVQSPYNSSILSIIDTINVIKRITMYSSFVFLIFSIILLTNFIFTSVNYRKKDIGILRALGARKIDIIKIFSWESMILTLLSALISSILLFYTSKFLNNTILENSLIISPFMPTIQTVSFIIFAIFIISIIATIISINKISKMKPVDAIYNRK